MRPHFVIVTALKGSRVLHSISLSVRHRGTYPMGRPTPGPGRLPYRYTGDTQYDSDAPIAWNIAYTSSPPTRADLVARAFSIK